MTVRLAELDAALTRATGLGLAGTLAAIGEPLRNRPAAAAVLAAARAALTAAAEGSPLNESCPWYPMWLSGLSTDGTLTRLANTGDMTTLGEAVRVLEYIAARPVEAQPVAVRALAAHITGDTKALNHGSTLATLIMRALALREGIALWHPPLSDASCGTFPASSSTTWPAGYSSLTSPRTETA